MRKHVLQYQEPEAQKDEFKTRINRITGENKLAELQYEWQSVYQQTREYEDKNVAKGMRIHKGGSLFYWGLSMLMQKDGNKEAEAHYLIFLAFIEDLLDYETFKDAKTCAAYQTIKNSPYISSQLLVETEERIESLLQQNSIPKDPETVIDRHTRELLGQSVKKITKPAGKTALNKTNYTSDKPKNAYQVFVSHTHKDKITCDKLDSIASRVGIRVFRSEYEHIPTPAWETIRVEMKLSKAMFLLVGPKLVEEQMKDSKEWKFTQNWIAYEVGLACALGKDVWVVCDDVEINFPVPYFNNYIADGLKASPDNLLRKILKDYAEKKKFQFKEESDNAVCCPNGDCGAKFNYFEGTPKEETHIVCPGCLRKIRIK
jgi:hypothetical protein